MKRKIKQLVVFLLSVLYCVDGSTSGLEASTLRFNVQEDIKYLDSMAWHSRKLYPDTTIHYCELAIEKLSNTADSNKIAKYYNFLGIAHHYKGDNLTSFEFYERARQYAAAHQDTIQLGHAMNNLGRFFSNQGDYSRAIDYGKQALEIFESLNDLDGIAYGLKRMSEMYVAQGYLPEAYEATQKSLAIRVKNFDKKSQANTHVDLALIYAAMDSLDQAFVQYDLARQKANEADDAASLVNIYMGLSALHIRTQNFEKAVVEAFNAKEKAQQFSNLDLINRSLLQYGKALFHNSKHKESADNFLLLLSNSQLSNQLELQQDAYYYLSEIYALQRNGMKAHAYLQKYMDISDQLNNSEARRAIDSLLYVVQLERQSQENQLLKANEEKNKALITAQKNQTYVLIAILIAVLIYAFSFWRVSKRRKQFNEELQEKNKGIK